MPETTNHCCPLCADTAEFYRVDYGHLKYFRCPNCTYFQISERAERALAQAPQQWRDNHSEMAKRTPPEHLLVIKVPPAQPDANGSSVALSAKYYPKSECSL